MMTDSLVNLGFYRKSSICNWDCWNLEVGGGDTVDGVVSKARKTKKPIVIQDGKVLQALG